MSRPTVYRLKRRAPIASADVAGAIKAREARNAALAAGFCSPLRKRLGLANIPITHMQKDAARVGVAIGFLFVSKIGGKDYYDLHQDHIPESEIVPAAHYFAKNGASGDVMHDRVSVAKCPWIMPVTSAIAKALKWVVPMTGLLIGWEPNDKSLLDMIDDGTHAAFSLDGTAYSVED